jgi:hypothetical protein
VISIDKTTNMPEILVWDALWNCIRKEIKMKLLDMLRPGNQVAKISLNDQPL